MLEVSNVQLPLDAGLANGTELVRTAAAVALGVAHEDVSATHVIKRSVDARKKNDVHFVATLGVEFTDSADEDRALVVAEMRKGAGAVAGTRVRCHEPYKPLAVPPCAAVLAGSGEPRPVVVGTGPAGLFCALYLARAGLMPLVLERGGDVDERLHAVAAFDAGGALDPQTNIQFGEGGAGTFSDGKLTTNVKNPLVRHVLRWFVDAGAPDEVLWQAKPHIGTDHLVGVVRTLRTQIEQAGGEVRFHAQLVGLKFEKGMLAGVDVLDGRTGELSRVAARRVVLACGHSARDTFNLIYRAHIAMEQKPFSVGVRIEHAQDAIDRAQYGRAAGHPALGPADYKLAVHLPADGGDVRGRAGVEGRGVYTFCMCPGGQVVCAASESGGVVVNGMSRFAREGASANSALLVGVVPDDYGCSHPLAGVDLQRRMEHAAYESARRAGGTPYVAPAQRVGDFLAGCAGRPSATVQPTYARGVAWCDLRECLPTFVTDALVAGLPLLDRKLCGFADADAVMTGVETRSSSPVRIVRDESLQARLTTPDSATGEYEPNNTGLYPCGEGAGYAGGIMSAASDGLRVARAVCAALDKY